MTLEEILEAHFKRALEGIEEDLTYKEWSDKYLHYVNPTFEEVYGL